MNIKKIGAFLGGVVFGTAGIAILSGNDAKKVYTHCTAAVLRGKDSVVKKAMILKENCGDIYEDARDLTEKRYAAQELSRIEEARAIIEEYDNKDKSDTSEKN